MPSYEFILRIPPPAGRLLTDAEIDALFDAGFSDSGIEHGPAGIIIDVDREAPSREAAVASAVTAACRVLNLPASFIAVEDPDE